MPPADAALKLRCCATSLYAATFVQCVYAEYKHNGAAKELGQDLKKKKNKKHG